MAKLLILADDFTGAMDTAIQFAKRGIRTKVGTDTAALLASAGDAEVLAVNTETRHSAPEEAYKRIWREARAGRKAGIPFLYKKTDSALRGNIGAELSAALTAREADFLSFVPAYPVMGRTTRGGIHYVHDVPVAQSDFGKDPFAPVPCSEVKSLLRPQSKLPVILHGENQPKEPFIEVYDAQSDEDLQLIARALRDGDRLAALAGCAGFSAVLPDVLGLKTGKPETIRGPGTLLVLCGSLHPVTRAQIKAAEQAGFVRFQVPPEVKLGIQEALPRRKALMESIADACRGERAVIVDANDGGATDAYVAEHGIPLSQVRGAVSRSMGAIGVELIQAGVHRTLLITGGDTLQGFAASAGRYSLDPVAEILPGVVRARLELDGKRLDIITKSGGFGDERLLTTVASRLQGEEAKP